MIYVQSHVYSSFGITFNLTFGIVPYRYISPGIQYIILPTDISSISEIQNNAHKALLSVEKQPPKMEDDEWNDIDFCAKGDDHTVPIR